MVQDHPVFTPPPYETKIWRYVDFAKFVSLLETRAIWFPPATSFTDPFEGSMPSLNVRERDQWLPDAFDDPSEAQRLITEHREIRKAHRRWTFISCWHMNEHESEAMWKLYGQTGQAIAIRSNYSSLRACLPNTPSGRQSRVHIGMVRYIDYAKDSFAETNVMWPFVHKRKSFAHEQELRAVISCLPPPDATGTVHLGLPSPPGVAVPVDLDRLIHEIYVAPMCPGWFKGLVEKVLARYELAKEVRQSALDALPVF